MIIFSKEKVDNAITRIIAVAEISTVAVHGEYSLMIELFISFDTVNLNLTVMNHPRILPNIYHYVAIVNIKKHTNNMIKVQNKFINCCQLRRKKTLKIC